MGLLNKKSKKIKSLETENNELKEKLNKKSFFSNIFNFFKSKKTKDNEIELEKLRVENEKLKQSKKQSKLIDKSNEVTGDIWESMSKMSSDINNSIFSGVNIANDKSNKILEQIKENVDEYSESASGLKLEEVLANNFNENLFIRAILEKKINFNFKGERNIYDFLEYTGTKYIWKSDWEYFEFTGLKNKNKTFEFIFKINHIDVKISRIHVDYERLYEIIVNKKDTLKEQEELKK